MNLAHEQLESINHSFQHYEFDVASAKYEDTVTWLSEVLDGQMRTEFEFGFDGHELIGSDGRQMGQIFDDAIEDAQIIATRSPHLSFELRRRQIEKSEYNDMIAMMKDELPNTMIVVSDFPQELVNAKNDQGGYNVNRKQTMLRVITKNLDDTLTIQTQSLDGSDRTALESIYDAMGAKPRNGELLEQRIHVNVPRIWQKELINNLTNKYDDKLSQIYGGKWHAGRKPADYINTYDFVRSQSDLIDVFMGTNEPNNNMRFNLAAAIESRFKNRHKTELGYHIYPNISHPQVMVELQTAGNKAKLDGKTYSGCGMSLKAEDTMQNNLEQLGYGNKSAEDKYGSLDFKCQKGHHNTRPRNKLIDRCKTCGISVKC